LNNASVKKDEKKTHEWVFFVGDVDIVALVDAVSIKTHKNK